MSKVVHPFAHRLPLIREWKSRWFKTGAAYREALRADALMREFLEKALHSSYVADVEFERNRRSIRIIIKTSRPGMVIGRSGENATKIRNNLLTFMKKHAIAIPEELKIDVLEIQNPEADARIMAHVVREALERRLPFRRVLKQTTEKIMAARGVKGAKIALSGRLGGADMSRREELKLGGIPLQFMRGDVDFARDRAQMSYGGIGIKVWIYRGDSLEQGTKK